MKFQYLLIGTSLSLIPQTINAQCVATQDCATLGYTETSCSGGSGVKCPFGNKWACFESDSEIKNQLCSELGFTQTCTGTNQISGVGKPCNSKYAECTCSSGYAWNDSSQICEYNVKSSCAIGTLYYSDGTCSDKLESSKTLLGVVIYEKSDNENGWIMTVKPVEEDIAWSPYRTDIAELPNYELDTDILDIQASCTNTEIITAQGKSSSYPAAWAAKNYKPTGTPSGKSWCLPSGGLLRISLLNSISLARINAGITTAGGIKIGKADSTSETLLSSSENDYHYIWALTIITRYNWHAELWINHNPKANKTSMRPVLAF